ncbi:MAG: DMT family transporter [Microbacterium hominis]|nr:DMT family transporter [Microbacterium hominis]
MASFIGLSEVLFALGFAWLLLGETPAAIQFVGGALLLGGVILVRMDAAEADAVSVPADPILPVPTLPVPTAGEARSGTR